MKASVVIISKDEAKLADTLVALRDHLDENLVSAGTALEVETIVVDASCGRLAHIAAEHAWVRWLDFTAPPGVRVSIPHQRNFGVGSSGGEIVVFTDSGCVPQAGWLERLVRPIVTGAEEVTAGPSWIGANVYSPDRGRPSPTYLDEAPTINLAFRREIFDAVGGFDERFAYGSDVDFTWRVVASGRRIRFVDDAVVVHDWGNFERQLKRSRQYGAARIRLYRKHRDRLRRILHDDPVPVLYPLYLLGLPLALRWKGYLLLPLVPLWRARGRPYPLRVVICHFAEGVGSLRELAEMVRGGPQ